MPHSRDIKVEVVATADPDLRIRVLSVNVLIRGRTELAFPNLTPGETFARAYQMARKYKKHGVSLYFQAFDENGVTLLRFEGFFDLHRVDDYKAFIEGHLPKPVDAPVRKRGKG